MLNQSGRSWEVLKWSPEKGSVDELLFVSWDGGPYLECKFIAATPSDLVGKANCGGKIFEIVQGQLNKYRQDGRKYWVSNSIQETGYNKDCLKWGDDKFVSIADTHYKATVEGLGIEVKFVRRDRRPFKVTN